MPTFKDQRQTYNGPIEIWIGGAKRMDATVRLSGFVDVSVIQTLGQPEQRMDGVSSWGGYLDGASDHDVIALVGDQLELRFPDGRVGHAVLTDKHARLHGIRETPFD